MMIIARRRRKFRNQNWRYGHRNNHFGLNADFREHFSIFFQGSSQFSGCFRDLSRGINHFRVFSGFSGVSGVAGHPVRRSHFVDCISSIYTEQISNKNLTVLENKHPIKIKDLIPIPINSATFLSLSVISILFPSPSVKKRYKIRNSLENICFEKIWTVNLTVAKPLAKYHGRISFARAQYVSRYTAFWFTRDGIFNSTSVTKFQGYYFA